MPAAASPQHPPGVAGPVTICEGRKGDAGIRQLPCRRARASGRSPSMAPGQLGTLRAQHLHGLAEGVTSTTLGYGVSTSTPRGTQHMHWWHFHSEAWEREPRSGQLESLVISDNVTWRCASPQTSGYHRGRENKLPAVPTTTHRLNHNTCFRYFLLKEEAEEGGGGGKSRTSLPPKKTNTALIFPSFFVI